MSEFIKLVYIGSFYKCDMKTEKVLLVFLNLMVWIVTIILLVIALDFLFKVDHKEEMILKEKYYQPEYVFTVSSGKVITTQYHPESFNLYFDKLSCSVSESLFEDSNYGDLFSIDYYSGITGINYCVDAVRIDKDER